MKHTKYIVLTILAVAVVFFAFLLQNTQEYLFFFREQLMVFYNDVDIIASRYLGIGGLSLLLSHWLTQYFVLEYAGSVITSLLGVASAILLWHSIPRKMSSLLMLPLCFLPVIFQEDALFDVYYAYQGFVAYFLFTLFSFAFRSLQQHLSSDLHKALSGAALSLVLFYFAGATAFLFVCFVFVCSAIDKPRKCYFYIIPVAVILIAAEFCVAKAYLPLYRDALLNSAYYEPILEPTNFFHTSWIITLLLPLFSPLFISAENHLKPIIKAISTFAILILICGYAYFSSGRNQQKMYPMIAMDHYIVKGDWDGLLNSKYSQTSNFIMMNRVNLALSKSGRFLDDMFKFGQMAPYSLMTNLENLSLDVEITSTICEIYWQLDNIASADERAFNSYEGLRYGSPSNLKMMVRTSLVFGRYRQAEKYIKMLELTTFYKDWATAQRRFLYNDEAVEADPEYGSKRKSLPLGTRDFVQARGPYADLLVTLRANPHATAARDYAIGYLILANDVKHINSFTEEFYGTEAMPTTPLRLQEAILAANEKDLDFCRAHGVEEKTISDYQRLKKNFIQAKASGTDPAYAIREWRHTYWYFLLVTSSRLAQMREQMIKQQEAQESDKPQIGAHG